MQKDDLVVLLAPDHLHRGQDLLEGSGAGRHDEGLALAREVAEERRVRHLVGGDLESVDVRLKEIGRAFVERRGHELYLALGTVAGQQRNPLVWHLHLMDDVVDWARRAEVLGLSC